MSTYGNLPVQSVADGCQPSPKTLLDCCRDAQEFMDEYDLDDGYDKALPDEGAWP